MFVIWHITIHLEYIHLEYKYKRLVQIRPERQTLALGNAALNLGGNSSSLNCLNGGAGVFLKLLCYIYFLTVPL